LQVLCQKTGDSGYPTIGQNPGSRLDGRDFASSTFQFHLLVMAKLFPAIHASGGAIPGSRSAFASLVRG
jgi:hypothetical protein